MASINPNTQYLVADAEQYQLSPLEVLPLTSKLYYRLVLLRQSDYNLHTHRRNLYQGKGAGIYLIPPGELCSLQAQNEALSLIILPFKAHPGLCLAECPNRDNKKIKINSCLSIEEQDKYKDRPRRSKPCISYIDLPPAVKLWVDSVFCLLSLEGVKAQHLDVKMEELFNLLRLAYPRDVMNKFLQHYHCRIEGFRERIIYSYRSDMEVCDLYTIGETMGLKEIAFKRSFCEEFGIPPREWLIEQRAKSIYHLLTTTDKPLKELSYEFGFCSVSHFGVFCRQTLGDTPLHIRKSIQSK